MSLEELQDIKRRVSQIEHRATEEETGRLAWQVERLIDILIGQEEARLNPPPFQPGDRIKLVRMINDPDPIPPGTTGTVVLDCHWLTFGPQPCWQVTVQWDTGRGLSLCIPPDVAVKI